MVSFWGMVVLKEAGAGTGVTPEVNIDNVTPSVGTVYLAAITLTGASTTVSGTTTITDNNGWGDISSATATLYNSASTCGAGDANANWCYYITACTLGVSTTYSRLATCSANVWFVAEPTAGTSAVAGDWQMDIKATAASSTTATASSATTDVNSYRSSDVTATLDYGTVGLSATSSDNNTTSVSNMGNIPIDVEIHGVDMESGAYTLIIDRQKFSSTTLGNWVGTIATSTHQDYDLLLAKPHATTTGSFKSNKFDDIYWMIKIPTLQQKGAYTGTNTVGAIDAL